MGLLAVITGCFYAGNFRENGTPFAGKRVAFDCLDLAVTQAGRPACDRPGDQSSRSSVPANRCFHQTHRRPVLGSKRDRTLPRRHAHPEGLRSASRDPTDAARRAFVRQRGDRIPRRRRQQPTCDLRRRRPGRRPSPDGDLPLVVLQRVGRSPQTRASHTADARTAASPRSRPRPNTGWRAAGGDRARGHRDAGGCAGEHRVRRRLISRAAHHDQVAARQGIARLRHATARIRRRREDRDRSRRLGGGAVAGSRRRVRRAAMAVCEGYAKLLSALGGPPRASTSGTSSETPVQTPPAPLRLDRAPIMQPRVERRRDRRPLGPDRRDLGRCEARRAVDTVPVHAARPLRQVSRSRGFHLAARRASADARRARPAAVDARCSMKLLGLILAMVALSITRADARGCTEHSDVVGLQHCSHFGTWSRDDDQFPRLWLDVGYARKSYRSHSLLVRDGCRSRRCSPDSFPADRRAWAWCACSSGSATPSTSAVS